jgi:hypothetical protein
MDAIDISKQLTEKEARVVRAMVTRLTERGAAEALHISRNSLQRLLARLPSQRGTVALVRVRLTALGAMRWTDSGERTTPV